jgi:cholesterol transport system auxiliary component
MKKPSCHPYRLGFLMVFSIAGCVSLSFDKQYAERRYFVLDVNHERVSAGSNSAGVLKVANMRVSPRFDGKGFVYRTAEMNYETDFYNQFLVSPASMFTDEVRQALSQANIFEYVVNPDSQLEPTHRLEGIVEALYGDFSDKGSPQAVLAMSFLLSREAPAGSELFFQKRYRRVVPVQKRTPEALVRGWNEGLEGILTALVAELRSTLRENK